MIILFVFFSVSGYQEAELFLYDAERQCDPMAYICPRTTPVLGLDDHWSLLKFYTCAALRLDSQDHMVDLYKVSLLNRLEKMRAHEGYHIVRLAAFTELYSQKLGQ